MRHQKRGSRMENSLVFGKTFFILIIDRPLTIQDNRKNKTTMAPENESPFLKGFETCKILRPSIAYRQACSSYPYRISELVFGSLLAAYILGFVSVGTSQLHSADAAFYKTFCDALVYMSICCSFSFLTAALYSVYHHSILTMPNVPISDLTTDFLIAISQAVFFGISIIWPSAFFICLGLLLLLVFMRQEIKFRALAKFYYNRLGVVNTTASTTENSVRDDSKKIPRKFHDLFQEKLKPIKLLDGWGPVKAPQYAYAVVLILLGIGILLIYWIKPLSALINATPPKWTDVVEFKVIRGIVYPIVGLIFFVRTKKILQEKSTALDDWGQKNIEKMDAPAAELARAVKNSPIKNL